MQQDKHEDDLVMSLVELARNCRPEERETCLLSACGGDTELLERVRNYISWERRMEGFLEEPLFSSEISQQPFQPGELLVGRFRILRQVAQGGMGVVYEAHDEKLDRRVALKSAKPGFGRRLPPEVRAASEITHPNVCRIFEIHSEETEAGPIDFVTMEFLDGETLSQRLARGRLPYHEARLIAQQLAAGVAEAHRNNVVHGDLKCNNVLLTKGPDGSLRAVITDFGLARRSEPGPPIAGARAIEGTPEYMAPELWSGAPSSTASDIYALGVCLHELACGRRPDPARARLSDEKLDPVDPKWDRILRRCLHPDPAKRYGSVAEVLKALSPVHTRRWFAAAAAATVLAVASSAVTWTTAVAPEETVRLAVAPFRADNEAAHITAQLTRNTIARIGELEGSDKTEFELLSSIAEATHILAATVTSNQQGISITAVITEARQGTRVKEWKAAYRRSELHYIPVALAGVVTGAFRLPAAADVPEMNATAHMHYKNGLAHMRKNSEIDRALTYMEQAVQADPHSPLTHAGLAEAQWWKYRISGDATRRDRSLASLAEAERRNPDLPQVLSLAGAVHTETEHYKAAADSLLRALELDPHNGDAYRRLGLVYEKDNRGAEALAAYQSAIDLDPRDHRNHWARGTAYSTLGNHEEALRDYQKAVELEPGEARPLFALGRAHAYLGRFAEAEQAYRRALAIEETPQALNALAVALAYQGRDQEAIPLLERALAGWPNRFLWWMNLGSSYRRLHLITEAERAFRKGLSLAEAETRRNPRDGYVRASMAFLLARLGEKARAESEVVQALHLSPADVDARWMAVKTHEALGNREATLACLNDGPDSVIADANRYPDLADLRKDRRFQSLLTRNRAIEEMKTHAH